MRFSFFVPVWGLWLIGIALGLAAVACLVFWLIDQIGKAS